jgi:hypothetical protein
MPSCGKKRFSTMRLSVGGRVVDQRLLPAELGGEIGLRSELMKLTNSLIRIGYTNLS